MLAARSLAATTTAARVRPTRRPGSRQSAASTGPRHTLPEKPPPEVSSRVAKLYTKLNKVNASRVTGTTIPNLHLKRLIWSETGIRRVLRRVKHTKTANVGVVGTVCACVIEVCSACVMQRQPRTRIQRLTQKPSVLV
ncbi:hypothetical protein O3G_MSEX002935 [Manduca sexta]|uniref:Uncharacterized protein n=1 Tax=Manduca sexta TaxID=7130 RepID=A0A921YQM9_MANSE|nr:hypothetical protein O3G_MSEX002935 [Manduca sexta]